MLLRRMSSTFEGPRKKMIEATLTSALAPTHLEVVNESHGRVEDESHFFACVVSDKFAAKKLLERHRMVSGALTQDDGNLPFHSLRITAKTPDEWAKSHAVPAAPKCAGGDGRK
mmetsp:Transcript_1029/g.3514  ORF Transcript_1029/g.3514 Transcript_1029/m.3514 type:complete len:114 (-) Transcript_1029:495-836(-)